MFLPNVKFYQPRGMLLILLSTTMLLSSCSGVKPVPVEEPTRQISVITGKPQGTNVLDLDEKTTKNVSSLPVNALLWRAALDVASFVPLDDVDTFGGTILTEWHQSTKNADERLKLAIFVIGLELRSDAVKVQTYTQKKLDNDWVDNGRDEALARKLEDLILTRARELRAALVSETKQ